MTKIFRGLSGLCAYQPVFSGKNGSGRAKRADQSLLDESLQVHNSIVSHCFVMVIVLSVQALYSFQVGKRGGQLLGYAAIESHNVRTQPETEMIVLSPTGELHRVEMLAFHEPPEYQPPPRWFEKLYGKPYKEMRVNQVVDGIAGVTLSSHASLDGIRKVMAIYQFAVKEGKNQ